MAVWCWGLMDCLKRSSSTGVESVGASGFVCGRV